MGMTQDRQQLFSGTEAPPEHLALDVARLARHLSDKVPELGAGFGVEKFKGGQSNPTYRLTPKNGGAAFVLRRRPPGELLASAHDIAREYRVMSALSAAGFPVPRAFHFCEDESVIGSIFYVVSCHDGTVYWNADMPGETPPWRRGVYDDMNARLAQLHRLDPAGLGLADLAPAGGYAARNLARWTKIYRQSQLAEVPDMDWLIARLPEIVPGDAPTCLIHGDYGLYNILVSARAPEVEAVLDWEMATLGDPFIDLAHHLRAWWEPEKTNGAASSLRGRDLAALGIPDMEAHIALYCDRLGISELPHRAFYLGYAQFRYVAMIQGILKRASIGTSSSRTVLHSQERVFEIAAMARRTIASGG